VRSAPDDRLSAQLMPVTSTGVVLDVVVPLPSWPAELSPQQ
jgi:hypothetical protein